VRINAANVCNHFLSMYQNIYEKQMLHLLEHFMSKEDHEN